MLGGYQILDLRKIDLVISTTQSTITNAYVLSQLLKLRDFIDKDYDFSKPIENQLKPVLIRYRDKKNGEKSEGAMFGELAVVDNYYTFKITGRISGALILTIKVAFHEITNAYGAKEWVINTAKIQLQDVIEDLEGNLALEGDLDVSGDLDVEGSISGGEIVEKMTGYSAIKRSSETWGIENVYTGIVKNGNKLTFVSALNIEALQDTPDNEFAVVEFTLPAEVASKLYPTTIGGAQLLSNKVIVATKSTDYSSIIELQCYSSKSSNKVTFAIKNMGTTINEGDKYYLRIEETFLLSDNLISNE